MRALVVYESMFGNTRDVAEAVARGLAGDATVEAVEAVEVGAAPSAVPRVDLLVVGGPTHAFGMTRASTRADAARQAGGTVVSGRIGVREWLDDLDRLPAGLVAATFDTRVSSPRVPGSAARAMHHRLGRLGATMAGPPRTFWVGGIRGPLGPDERRQAEDWGAGLTGSFDRVAGGLGR